MQIIGYNDKPAKLTIYYKNSNINSIGFPRYIADILNEIKSTGKVPTNKGITNALIEIVYNKKDKDLKQQYILSENMIIYLVQKRVPGYHYYSNIEVNETFFIHSIYLISKDTMNKLELLGKNDFTDEEIEQLALKKSTKIV
jgi:hypothetical protein